MRDRRANFPLIRRVVMIVAASIAIVAACTALPGCSALEGVDRRQPSRTGEVTMSLSIARPADQAFELFRVTRLGDLEYGGGMKAFNDATSWSGVMSDEEIAQFLARLEESGWCEQAPPSDPESTVRVRIELLCASGRHTWNLRGEAESVTSMRALLEPIARRRFDAKLDRLPEASERRGMTRGVERAGSASEAKGQGTEAPQEPAAPSGDDESGAKTTPAPPAGGAPSSPAPSGSGAR